VYGCSLFGGYSSRVLVPGHQLTARPAGFTAVECASLPTVAGTALHALHLAGFWPQLPLARNKAVLVHSAAGGVGSMLVQMAKLLGCFPVVAVVGASHKVAAAKALGADVVIDKSSCDLWPAARAAVAASEHGASRGSGYAAVFDANGVSTLADSYAHLACCGRLVVYGFHSNLPVGADLLSPLKWCQMALGMARMPHFDPMCLTLDNRAVLGFNLSFFAEETAVIKAYLAQIDNWVTAGKVGPPAIEVFEMADVACAHRKLQSGASVGKCVVRTGAVLADVGAWKVGGGAVGSGKKRN
jgi:NADPH:quinone reductase-like Zn-dependent oxidoreductase